MMLVRGIQEGYILLELWTCGMWTVDCGRVEQDPPNDEQSMTEFERESRNSEHYGIVEQKTLYCETKILYCGTRDIIDEK
jgi:hypothetical protein